MTRLLVIAFLAVVSKLAFVGITAGTEIFLPPDSDKLTIYADGLKLDISRLNLEELKQKWQKVSDDAAQVETPRDNHDDSSAIVNEGLFEKIQSQSRGRDYGEIDDDLLKWITDRVTSLSDRVKRYSDELPATSDGTRIVQGTLILNTLVDLDNIRKEQLVALKWLIKKLKTFERLFTRDAISDHIQTYVSKKVEQNKAIEDKILGSNKPNQRWHINTQAITRILHEQRFSSSLGEYITDYLGGSFSMMKRSTVYNKMKLGALVDDGLYYFRARGKVPARFPFFSQDAIVNGA